MLNRLAIEEYVDFVTDLNPNMLVPWYLILSYAYYALDNNLVSDHFFDSLAHNLYEKLDAMEIEHRHMGLIDLGNLKHSVSAYYISEEEYPSMVASVAAGIISGRITLD